MQREEKVLVCLSGSPSNARVVRAAAKIAEAFRGTLVALFVEPANFELSEAQDKSGLARNIHLAKSLGAQITTLYGDDAAAVIAEYARVAGISKIVVGRSPGKRGLFARKSLVDRLGDIASDIDIYIIPDRSDVRDAPLRPVGLREEFSLRDVLITLLILALCTGIGYLFSDLGFSTANVIVVYILGVLTIAMLTAGRSYSLAASIMSVLIFNFFFTEPYFSLFSDPSHIVTFIVMFATALFISSITAKIKLQTHRTALRVYRTEILLETSQELQRTLSAEQMLAVTAEQLGKLLEQDVIIYPVVDGALGSPQLFPVNEDGGLDEYLDAYEHDTARWVLENDRRAGAGTSVRSDAKGLYMAVHASGKVFAVAGIAMKNAPPLESFEKTLAIAILDECGLVLENENSRREKRLIEEKARTEELRANLLRSISHDLRTPLTSISGTAALLLENELSEEKQRQMYISVYDDSRWLIDLVENLLSITRIEGSEKLTDIQPELIDDVFREAVSHADRMLKNHRFEISLDDELLLAYMDARLIVQVIINLLNNAVKYTPEGSHITLSAHSEGDKVAISVSDDGSGIADEAKEKIFDMFYTANKGSGDARRGLGLGLALCKSIVQAHGGSITVEDNVPHGAVFKFTLPKAEVQQDE